MIRAKARLLVLLLPFSMAACASSGGYPSLAVRDVERASGSMASAEGENSTPAPILPPATADLVTRLSGLVKVAQEADRRFQSDRPVAERAAAAAGAVGSDSWSAASVALAKLETSRSLAMSALGELDVLYADARANAPLEESPSVKAISDARDEVAAVLDGQDKVIVQLAGRLRT